MVESYLVLILVCCLALVILGALLYFSLLRQDKKKTVCPYTGHPLREACDLHFRVKNKILRYLFNLKQYDNRMFDLEKAAYCRDTGRVFKDCINWKGQIEVDWSFIQKAYPGNYVSWGSLTEEQQLLILHKHGGSISGYQTEDSSPSASPRSILRIYALLKPGPLYVDYQTGILVGWKEVPDTDVEVLIIQKPLKIHLPNWKSKENEKK